MKIYITIHNILSDVMKIFELSKKLDADGSNILNGGAKTCATAY